MWHNKKFSSVQEIREAISRVCDCVYGYGEIEITLKITPDNFEAVRDALATEYKDRLYVTLPGTVFDGDNMSFLFGGIRINFLRKRNESNQTHGDRSFNR